MTTQLEAIRLADTLAGYTCSCIDGFTWRGLTDPQCHACAVEPEASEAAAALRRQYAEIEALKAQVTTQHIVLLRKDTEREADRAAIQVAAEALETAHVNDPLRADGYFMDAIQILRARGAK